MNSGNSNKKLMKWFIPVALACIVAVLLFFTVPLAFSPARVFGGYTTIGSLTVVTPDNINVCSEEPVTVTISGVDPDDIDIASIRFNGAPWASWHIAPDGSLVLVFDPATLNLTTASTTATFTGNMKDGTPFSGSIAVTCICIK